LSISALIWLTRPLTSSASPWPSTIVVSSFGDHHAPGRAEQVDGRVLELQADLLGDDLRRP
jgi:hypothetical protein